MKKLLSLLVLVCMEKALHAQYIYTIKADSVKITNSCDTAELIIENHTQTVPGFLYNKGRGRTEFRRGMIRTSDSVIVIGGDTLKINPWLQGGNRFGTTGILGTMDNNHIDFYTNGIKRGRLDNIGRFNLDYPVGDAVDAFSLTTLNGTKKWFNIYSDVNGTSMSFNKLTSFAGDLESMRITANGSGSTIETFAYSDLAMKAYGGLDLYGGYGAGATKYIRFFPHGTQAAMFNWNGNFLLGGETDYEYKLAVNGTTYSKYYTNSTTHLGNDGSDAAVRLRWGGTEGTYIDFYYQDSTKRRGYISSGSDSRPLVLTDKIGLTFGNTPYVSMGSELPFSKTYFSVTSPYNPELDPMRVAKINNETSLNSDSYLRVKASGNTILGEGDDNGFRFQVNGTSWVRDYHTVGTDNYMIRMVPYYGNMYGTNLNGSGILFGNIKASIGVNRQIVGTIPEGSLMIGGTAPGRWVTITDYSRNPTFVTDGYGAVVINGGYSGIANGEGVEVNAKSHLLYINGGIGTGTGEVGDIYFSTGKAQTSGSMMHSMITRWIIKGGTGYLSNHPNPKSLIDINGDNGYSQLRLRTSYTPTSTADTNGNTGDFSWDDDYFYIKTSEGWKRSALSTF